MKFFTVRVNRIEFDCEYDSANVELISVKLMNSEVELIDMLEEWVVDALLEKVSVMASNRSGAV